MPPSPRSRRPPTEPRPRSGSGSNGSNSIIQAATRPPGGSFGAPVDLSASGQSAARPQITTAPDGTATAVWLRYDGTNTIVQAATRPPGGGFGPPVDLSVAGQTAFARRVATAPDGTTTVVWSRIDGINGIIQAATRPPGGGFGPPVDLSALGAECHQPPDHRSRRRNRDRGLAALRWQRPRNPGSNPPAGWHLSASR